MKDIQKSMHLLSLVQAETEKGTIMWDAIKCALDCMTLVMNIDAVYNAQDANEATIYVVQDILEMAFKGDELNVFSE